MSVGDSWHKMMVYFGVAEDDEYDDEDDGGETMAPQEELERSYQERANVRRISHGRRTEYDDIFSEDPPARAPRGREREAERVVRAVQPVRPSPVEVHLVIPKNFNDAQKVADKFKIDVPVIINLQGADTELSKRLIDFCSGLTYSLDGGMQRIGEKIFLLTPRNVEVSAEEKARLIERGFFNQF